MPHKPWKVYLLKCADNTLYCGCTNDLEKRIDAHNSGKGAKYTKGRTPVKLVASISNLTKSEAHSIEYKVKKLRRSKKESFFATANSGE